MQERVRTCEECGTAEDVRLVRRAFRRPAWLCARHAIPPAEIVRDASDAEAASQSLPGVPTLTFIVSGGELLGTKRMSLDLAEDHLVVHDPLSDEALILLAVGRRRDWMSDRGMAPDEPVGYCFARDDEYAFLRDAQQLAAAAAKFPEHTVRFAWWHGPVAEGVGE